MLIGICYELYDRTVDVVFCSGAILETMYCILYIVLSASQLFLQSSHWKKRLFCKPLLSVNNINVYKIVILMPVTQSHISLL